jgi:hypothetical protein
MEELIKFAERLRDVGLLPYTWLLLFVWLAIKFPKFRMALVDAFTKPFLSTPAEVKRKSDPPTANYATYRHHPDVVLKNDCHVAMQAIDKELAGIHEKIDEKFTAVNDKIGEVSVAIGSLEGYIRGKLDK